MFGAMIVDSGRDLMVFLGFFLCAHLIGILFDFFRASRRVFVFKKTAVAVQDVIFCSLAFYAFSHVLTQTNSGELRWYEFAAVFLGLTIYFSVESRFVIKVFTVLCSWVCRLGALIKKFLKKSLQFKKNRL